MVTSITKVLFKGSPALSKQPCFALWHSGKLSMVVVIAWDDEEDLSENFLLYTEKIMFEK
jgi:hypothetical protein